MALIPRKTSQMLSGIGAVYVDVQGFRDLDGRFTKATDDLIEQRSTFIHRIGKEYVKRVKRDAPVHTGEFKRSINYSLNQKTKTSISLTVGGMDPLTKWIVGGTKPHIIATNRGRKTALYFFWQGGPRIHKMGIRSYFYYFKSIKHPGVQPNPLFENVALEMDEILSSELYNLATRWSIKLESF